MAAFFYFLQKDDIQKLKGCWVIFIYSSYKKEKKEKKKESDDSTKTYKLSLPYSSSRQKTPTKNLSSFPSFPFFPCFSFFFLTLFFSFRPSRTRERDQRERDAETQRRERESRERERERERERDRTESLRERFTERETCGSPPFGADGSAWAGGSRLDAGEARGSLGSGGSQCQTEIIKVGGSSDFIWFILVDK